MTNFVPRILSQLKSLPVRKNPDSPYLIPPSLSDPLTSSPRILPLPNSPLLISPLVPVDIHTQRLFADSAALALLRHHSL